MGAGKSSVGRLLADRLELAFVDADDEIERRSDGTIRQLFQARGEESFRVLEREVVADLLGRDRIVVALGGGAVEDPGTRELLRDAIVFHLDLPTSEALRRIGGDSERPMLLEHDPEKLHKRRRRLYEAVADATLPADGSLAEVVDEALGVLKELDSRTP